MSRASWQGILCLFPVLNQNSLMPVNYIEIKEAIIQNLSEEDSNGLDDVKGRVIKHFVNLENPAITLQSWRHEPMKEKVIESLKNKNLTVMCGGGKDSEFVLTIARIIQLTLLEEYGITFTLRVGIGRQPGMIDVYDNLEHCFDALGLKGDELADIFFIDGKGTSPYRKDYPIPDHMIALNRNNVLMNGHIFGGAGRRTFCDDCNKMLGGWIATALAYKDGADLFMTGDSPQELRNQIHIGVEEMGKCLKILLPEQGNLTGTQFALHMLKAIGDEHSRIIYEGNTDEIKERSINAEAVPRRTRFVSAFSRKMPYSSKNRVKFLTSFLGFSFDSLMFSFTESDCGNPALMCHLYGLIAEHAYKDVQDKRGNPVTYADGIREYVKYGTKKMREKEISEDLIAKMEERYKDDASIIEIRKKVEEYAERAYGLKPEHLVAMVYSPFTDKGKNLHRYLQYLANSGYPSGDALLNSEEKIRKMISGQTIVRRDSKLIADLKEVTGLTLEQTKRLYHSALGIDYFDRPNGVPHLGEIARILGKADNLYTGGGTFASSPGKDANAKQNVTFFGR